MENSLNKLIKILAVLIIIIFGIFTVFEFQKKHQIEFENDCYRFENRLNNYHIIDYWYNIDVDSFDDNGNKTIRICFNIYNYNETMNIDFDNIFNMLYEQFNSYAFTGNKVRNLEIDIMNYKPNENYGGEGIGIAHKEFKK